jgi:hypothetical protein
LHDLHHVFILQHVLLADALRSVLDRGAPHERVVEVSLEVAVNRSANCPSS